MNNSRRDFIKITGLTGTCIVYSGVLKGIPLDLLGQSTRDSNKPDWLEGPIISKGNNQEPYIFRVRRGGISVNEKEKYLYSHSEEYVKKVKDFGSTYFNSHVFKAFGIEAERFDIEIAKEFSKLLHKYEIKMGTYIGSTIGYETFLVENPEAEEWLAPDYLGKPVTYGDQYYRKRPYFPHPGYNKYVKRIIKIAIDEINSDLIHFDNPSNSAAPAVFHHPMAITEFREYLTKKYSKERLTERIGFSNVSRVVPPSFPTPGSFQNFDDPVTQEWIDFRCQKLADHYKEMAEYIRSFKKEVAVEINPHGITGANRAWQSGVDFPRLLAHTDVFWCEDGNPASVKEDGILISNIRSYKVGRTCNNKVFNSVGSSHVMAAETMAFNPNVLQSPGESLKKYIQFYQEHFDQHYRGTKNVADVAILRSFASMAYSNYNTHQSTILFEQSLIQAKIPFDIIFDDNLKNLTKYRVLVLANQECLSNDQLEIIRSFVSKGGALVATENSSMYDEWRRNRESFGLKDLFRLDRPSAIKIIRTQEGASELLDEFEVRQSGKPINNQFGQGKVVYIPVIEPSIERPRTASMVNKYWKLPLNYSDIIEAIKWASDYKLLIEVKAPLTVVAELTEQKDQNKMILHLINYNVKKEDRVKDINVSLKIPVGEQVHNLKWISPDREKEEPLDFDVKDDNIVFKMPELHVYGLVVIKLT